MRYYNSQSDVIGRNEIASAQNQENKFTPEHLYLSYCPVKTHYPYYDTTYFISVLHHYSSFTVYM